jgi:hypothetical protein
MSSENYVTLESIQKLARIIQKNENMQYKEALDEAAARCRFSNYQEALKASQKVNISRSIPYPSDSVDSLLTKNKSKVQISYGARHPYGNPNVDKVVNIPPEKRVRGREDDDNKFSIKDYLTGVLVGFYKVAEARGGHIDFITTEYAIEELNELIYRLCNEVNDRKIPLGFEGYDKRNGEPYLSISVLDDNQYNYEIPMRNLGSIEVSFREGELSASTIVHSSNDSVSISSGHPIYKTELKKTKDPNIQKKVRRDEVASISHPHQPKTTKFADHEVYDYARILKK